MEKAINTEAISVSRSFYGDSTALQKIKNADDQTEALKTIAKQFEALMYHEILKSMRAASQVMADKENPLSQASSDFANELYDGQLAQQLVLGNPGGIASMLVEQFSGRITDDQK
jgi:flagellar protein FlgJ